MKLKTLKDLETTEVCCVTNCFDESKEPIIEAKELREEAIKWIKEEITIKINTWLPAPEKEIQLIGMAVINHPEIQRWMNRFNIKDEELK